MYSFSGKNWEETSLNKRVLEKIKVENNYSELVSKLVLSRGFQKSEIDSISCDINIYNPFLKEKDFIKTAKILDNAISKNEKIIIYGDYDVDGCVSVSLFINFFKKISKNVDFFIPDRIDDGYGANLNTVKKILIKSPDLIVFLDCGSNSNLAIDYLNKKNVKSIVIDHHEIYKPYVKSNSLINPKKKCDYNEFNYFSASTLTYFFLDFFIIYKKLNFSFSHNLFYVLLSIVSDVMPLRKINRDIAIKVLNNFDINKNFLIKKIFEEKKIKKPLEIDDLAFLIIPVLNSAGRIGNPRKVVHLLTANDLVSKEKIIKDLLLLNEKRKIIENNTLIKIDLDIISKKNKKVLVIYDKFFHEGIIGIIASKLKEYFGKPCVVLTKSNKVYKASARSNLDFNIGLYIKRAIDLGIITNGGGHNLAAGFTINENKIDIFDKFINSMYMRNSKTHKNIFLSKISLSAINNRFLADISKTGPFGSSNPYPIFLLENVRIIKPKILKKKYIYFFIKSKSSQLIKAISFNLISSNLSKNLLNNKNSMDLIVQLKENLWNNKKNINVIVLDAIQTSNKA